MHILFKDTSYTHAAMSVPYIDLFLELWQWWPVTNETLRHRRFFLIFLLWTFYLSVSIFRQHIHMEYIVLGLYDITGHVLPTLYQYFLIEGFCNQGRHWTKHS